MSLTARFLVIGFLVSGLIGTFVYLRRTLDSGRNPASVLQTPKNQGLAETSPFRQMKPYSFARIFLTTDGTKRSIGVQSRHDATAVKLFIFKEGNSSAPIQIDVGDLQALQTFQLPVDDILGGAKAFFVSLDANVGGEKRKAARHFSEVRQMRARPLAIRTGKFHF